MTPQNAPRQMLNSTWSIPDPGNGGIILIEKMFSICEMVSTAGSQTRTLAAPTRPGIIATIWHKTDGGDITVTASAGLNTTGNTAAAFAEAGDLITIISVTGSSGMRWEILVNTGVTLA